MNLLAAPLGGSDCELLREGLMAQPANTISSFGFVAVGIAIAMLASRHQHWRARSLVLAGCLVATGLGSVAYHGPQPPRAELMHDVSIVYVLAFIALHDLSLLVPKFDRMLTALAAVAIALTGAGLVAPVVAPVAADIIVAGVIVAEALVYRQGLRTAAKRDQRRLLLTILAVFAIAGSLFVLGRTDAPTCDPTTLLQPHAAWHLAAAIAFGAWWWLAFASTHHREAVADASPSRQSANSAR